jgi:hypothetical protein
MTTFASISFVYLNSMKNQISIAWHGMDAGVQEILAILGGVGLVTLLAVVWAIYFRKRRRRRSSVQPARPHDIAPKRRRRLRHELRRRNPTLAETGGLPPAREEGAASLNP